MEKFDTQRNETEQQPREMSREEMRKVVGGATLASYSSILKLTPKTFAASHWFLGSIGRDIA